MKKRHGGLLLLLLCTALRMSAQAEDLLAMETTMEYDAYLALYSSAPRPQETLTVQAADYYAYTDVAPTLLNDYAGVSGVSLYTPDEGSVTWRVNVPREGLYNLFLHYCTVEGKGKEISRTVRVDGETPYDAAVNVKLYRVFVNELAEIRSDSNGNDLTPEQVESFGWHEEPLRDAQGYYTEALQFYFSAGAHEITLAAKSEPLVLRTLTLRQETQAEPYAAVIAGYAGAPAGKGVVRVEAESANAKSSPMLYARADRSSVSLTPHDSRLMKVNTIGGGWRQAGQWIEWTVDIPETGLYTLTLHARQNFVHGLPVLRKLTIDGELPFSEAEQLPFAYQSGWQYVTPSDTQGMPYRFYLTQGRHTLRLTNVLGGFAASIKQVEDSLGRLNEIYRHVVMITGVAPDSYRDYQLAAKLPQLSEWLAQEHDALQGVLDAFRAQSGSIGDREAPLVNMVSQLARLSADVEKMIPLLSDFRTSISSVGTWLIQARENPLLLDTIYFVGADETPELWQPNFLDDLWYEASSLAASYTIDYNAVGSMSGEAEKSITVWVATGRDQANVIKRLADDLFTPQSGVNVELALVDVNSLLPAILSGQGPDVAMLINSNLPMNYAMRGAVADLTQFEDFDQVASRFHAEAMVPFTFRDACYALPETVSFPMLFYRKDILGELGLPVPQTWDDVKAAISVLAKNNMWFGLNSLSVTGQAVMNVQTPYSILLYQLGGEYYTADGEASALDSAQGIEAFQALTKFYSDYTLEQDYDFYNLFRTGIMPVGISDLSTFNALQVFAPELDDLWGFTVLPGTPQADGTVDHTSPCGGLAIVMMAESGDKDAAWEYMKWWTSADTQVRYGHELEMLMGAAARYSTANLEALSRLPWDTADLRRIMAQYEQIKGVPEVPGGYYTSRCLTNAFYDVIVGKNIGAREALMDQVAIINSEIAYKREEFGIGEGKADE